MRGEDAFHHLRCEPGVVQRERAPCGEESGPPQDPVPAGPRRGQGGHALHTSLAETSDQLAEEVPLYIALGRRRADLGDVGDLATLFVANTVSEPTSQQPLLLDGEEAIGSVRRLQVAPPEPISVPD